MKMLVMLVLAAGVAFVLGVRIHPENFSDPASIFTVREQDNLLIQWGILPKKSKARVPGSVGSVWSTKPKTTATATASAPSQPTAKNAGTKASELARKATYASQF